MNDKNKDLKSSSAEIIADLLSDPRVRRGLKYLGAKSSRQTEIASGGEPVSV